MEEAGRGVRAENGETDCAFDEIEKEGCGGQGGRKEQAQKKNSEGLQRDRHRREPQRDRDVRANRDEERAKDDGQRPANECGLGKGKSGRCSGSGIHRGSCGSNAESERFVVLFSFRASGVTMMTDVPDYSEGGPDKRRRRQYENAEQKPHRSEDNKTGYRGQVTGDRLQVTSAGAFDRS
jgi:hypothetical protein